MSKTTVLEDTESVTEGKHPSSIPELATYFIKGESWVKHSKNHLRESYWWMTDQLFDEGGSLTQIGFSRMQLLFDKTSNTEIGTKRGRRVSAKRKPEMSIEDFKIWVWTTHRRFPADRPLETFAEPDNNPVDARDAIEVEFIEAETSPYDPTAQTEQNTEAILRQSGLTKHQNQTSFDQTLNRIETLIAARIENAIVNGVTQGQNRGMVKAVEALESELPTDVKPVATKTRKKSGGAKSA